MFYNSESSHNIQMFRFREFPILEKNRSGQN